MIRLISLLTLTSGIFAATHTLALRAQPDANSPIIHHMQVDKQLSIIHNPWLKVYDPISKKTGWIEQKELEKITKSAIAFTKTIVTRQGNQPSQIIEYKSNQRNIDPQMINQMIEHNQKIQQQVIREMSESFRSMEAISEKIWSNAPPELTIRIIEPQTNTSKKSIISTLKQWVTPKPETKKASDVATWNAHAAKAIMPGNHT